MASQAIAEAKALLTKRVRVTLTDGRCIEGALAMLDHHGNVVLQQSFLLSRPEDAAASSGAEAAAPSQPAFIGDVMAPHAHIVSVTVEADS